VNGRQDCRTVTRVIGDASRAGERFRCITDRQRDARFRGVRIRDVRRIQRDRRHAVHIGDASSDISNALCGLGWIPKTIRNGCRSADNQCQCRARDPRCVSYIET